MLRFRPYSHFTRRVGRLIVSSTPLTRVQERMAQFMLQTIDIPAMNMSIQAALSLHASGRSTHGFLDDSDGA